MDIARSDVPAYVAVPGGPEWIRGRVRLDDAGETIALAPETLERYSLWDEDHAAQVRGRPDLLFSLAGVKNPHDASAVARRFGLLGCGPSADAFAEPFAHWQAVATRLRLVLELVAAIQAEDCDRVETLIEPWPLSRVDVIGPLAAGSVLAEWLVNDGLRHVRERIVAAVHVSQDGRHGMPGYWFFAPDHDDLAGYAFHRLAQILGQRCELLTCANPTCGRVFVPNHGNRTTYCTPKCGAAVKKRRSRANHA